MAKSDEDIVIHFKGKYYMVKQETWFHGKVPTDGSLGKALPAAASDNAEAFIKAGGIVGYVPEDPAKMEGGYSTLINLDVILKGT
jgi:hypothetical protein